MIGYFIEVLKLPRLFYSSRRRDIKIIFINDQKARNLIHFMGIEDPY